MYTYLPLVLPQANSPAHENRLVHEKFEYNSPKRNNFQIWGIERYVGKRTLRSRETTVKLIKRTTYLSEMLELTDTPDIKVITGVRRSGKSKLMEALAQSILDLQLDANIIHINYNLTDFEDIMDYRSLEAYVEEHYAPGYQNYLLIDEVQMCESFEKAINSLHAREKYRIFVTGSNAFLQSSDLATLFVGRTYEVPVYPFSFAEYLEYFPSQNVFDSFTAYILDGGMAGSYVYKTE